MLTRYDVQQHDGINCDLGKENSRTSPKIVTINTGCSPGSQNARNDYEEVSVIQEKLSALGEASNDVLPSVWV